MIGDVNLFFKNRREDPEFEVECEVMIAGPSLPPLIPFTTPRRTGKRIPSPSRTRVPRSRARPRRSLTASVLRVRQARRKEGVVRSPHRRSQRTEHCAVHEPRLRNRPDCSRL
jgi:hypothetical protein